MSAPRRRLLASPPPLTWLDVGWFLFAVLVVGGFVAGLTWFPSV